MGIDTATEPPLARPTRDLRVKEKDAPKKVTLTTPHVPLAIASPKIPAAIVVVPITPPELATKGRMKKRMTRVNNPTNRRISTFRVRVRVRVRVGVRGRVRVGVRVRVRLLGLG